MPTHQKNFDRVDHILRQGNRVFVIPIFQRPYSWEENHIRQLLDDIDTGSKRKQSAFHYLSPVHVVEIDDFSQKEWCNYVDQSNEDIDTLNQANFRSDDGSTITVYMVIDGQQRLTTLFNLFWKINRNGLTLICQERVIPRIILNPVNDHYAFRQMLGLPAPSPAYVSRAQGRLALCLSKSIDPEYWPFVTGKGFQLLQVELDAQYALQAFQTQNDRGKSLTILEKLRSLIMEYDLNLCCGNVSKIHNAFSKVYRSLDRPGCYCNEEEFIQMLAIFARIPVSTDCLYQSAEAGYDDYFSKEPKVNSNPQQLLNDWTGMTSTLAQQLERLDNWLNKPSNLPSVIMPSAASRALSDDYGIVCNSLMLNIRNVAILCKFGELFPDIEWHDQVADVIAGNTRVAPVLEKKLRDAKGGAAGNLPALLSDKVEELEKRIDDLREPGVRHISILEVVERIQIFILAQGSSYPGGFKNYWNTIFKPGRLDKDAVRLWYEFATTNYADNRERFIISLFDKYLSETIRNYVLREFEYNFYGDNIHFNKSLQIEHIFPQNPTSAKPPLGYFQSPITTSVDYDGYVATLGNQMYLNAALNDSIGPSLPPIKANAYATQSNGTVVVPPQNQVKSAIAVGNDFNLIIDPQHYRTYLDIRAVEIAVFAAERFF